MRAIIKNLGIVVSVMLFLVFGSGVSCSNDRLGGISKQEIVGKWVNKTDKNKGFWSTLAFDEDGTFVDGDQRWRGMEPTDIGTYTITAEGAVLITIPKSKRTLRPMVGEVYKKGPDKIMIKWFIADGDYREASWVYKNVERGMI